MTRPSTIALLAVAAIALAGCYSTERAVFDASEHRMPAALALSYMRRDQDPALDKTLPRFVRFIPLPGSTYMAEFFNAPAAGEPASVKLAFVSFVPLREAWHIAEGGLEDSRDYQVVGLWPNLMEVARLKDVPEAVAVAAAKRRGLVVSGRPGPIHGAVAPAALKAFFGDLLEALPAAAVGDVYDAADVPEELAAEQYRVQFDGFEPARVTASRVDRRMISYMAALDARDKPWGSYALARARLAEGNRDEARRLAERAVAGGVEQAKYVLGSLARQGEGADNIQAGRLFREAAGAGDTRAMLALHHALRKGLGVMRSEREAMDLLRRAADGNLAAAQVELGRRHWQEDGVPRDDAAGFGWFEKAAKAGDAEGMTLLALAHAEGRGTPKNEQKATELFGSAAKAGWPLAQRHYGERVVAGVGVRADRKIGAQWLELAAKNGDAAAKDALQLLRAAAPRPCWQGSNLQCTTTTDGRALMRVPLGPGWFYLDGREAPGHEWPP